ncbi:ABC transporter substrate-binding protein [Bradyrhizobium sp. sBnM-33]|uniref:ABC transporter substrate-binding protein n=1 Tax=Bradyrhizobium sp. sBnM-33 TaxID=2831780 RepID=UPI001BCF2523|nr:ABC transporter substrate-binding protein [Bradyrhizobium sp. sBnM-33]WOH52483.1 ABC transporter substrate-binding protein [Bradyrhizobium sp. sBnM-33]
MNRLINRRRFMKATSSAIAVGALSSVAGPVSAASSDALRLNMSAGNFGEAIMNAFVKPFEAETGIKVMPVYQDIRAAQVGLMVKTNSVTIDAILVGQSTALGLVAGDYLEKIDYSIYNQQELDEIADYCKHPFGFGAYIYSLNMVYNTKKFPADRPRPTNWAEFWNVAKFPGVRSLGSGQFGNPLPGPFEEALLADGVPMDAIYPMDIDRIFASLDKIKPHIRKWWTAGAEILQIMRDGVADVVQSVDGRALSLIDQGDPFEINRNQAKLTWDHWIIPKGSPNPQNAQRFIAFTSRADRQAAFAQLFAQSPSNRKAYEMIPEKVARKLATYPDYMKTSFPVNGKWYAEIGSDGLSNSQRLIQRWNDWIVR